MDNGQIGHRIKLARLKEGLSLRDLSAKMDGLVSAQALGKYERDEMLPGSKVLLALGNTLNVSLDYLLAPKNTRLGQVDFRKHSRTSARDKAKVEAQVVGYVERYLQLECILGAPLHTSKVVQEKVSSAEEGEDLANRLRREWQLGTGPIPDVTELLEERGHIVIVIDLPDNVSGLTCEVHRDEEDPVHVLVANRKQSLERRRLTLLHELAHRYLVIPDDEKATEKAANRFAGAFLMPKEHLAMTFGFPRHRFEAVEILALKKVYRVSAAALWYRVYQLGHTSQSQYEYGCRTFGRGWRGKTEPQELEPLEDRGSKEMPRVFERKCYQALAEGLIGLSKAAELLEKPVSEVERVLRGQS